MREWDLPLSFQVVTWFHTEPCKATQFAEEIALLHLGARLVMSDLEAGVFGQGAFTVDPSVWKTTDLTEEQCLNARQSAAEAFGEVADDFSV